MIWQLCPGLFSTLRRGTISRGFLAIVMALLLLELVAVRAGRAQTGGERPEFQWPIVKGTYPDLKGLTSTFGESRVDHFHNGLDIAGLGDSIYPVAPGFVLYSRVPGDDPFAGEQGPGNFVYLYHGRGWASGYYHLKDDGSIQRSGPVRLDQAIGRAGNTGHSGGPHLHFFISADNGSRIINPLYLLPPATDKHAPIVGQIEIITPNGRTLVSHSRDERIRLTRSYPILLRIIDPGLEKFTRRGVYRLSWQLNGGERQGYNFSSVRFIDGDWQLEGGQVFDQVFQYDLYRLHGVEFRNGNNTLDVRAEDHSGNVTEVRFTISVEREY